MSTTLARCTVPPDCDAAQRAEELYLNGHYCAEAVLSVVNEVAGGPFSADVMRLGSCFWGGIAGDGGSCGALMGGVMAIGLLAGRTRPDHAWEPSTGAAAELRRRFAETCGGTSCDAVICEFEGMDAPGRHEHCARVCARTTSLILEIARSREWL
jgi:C_GCAxxG_C_C family probable redox protein